jgi:NADH-quinone oxidoreductase subunit A
MSPTTIAAYIVLFGSVGLLFLLISLLIGRLVRPDAPTVAKLEIYECGEPAVGTSFVQFDLRFYVVALVFIVFEVEVALFFPPAAIFGTAARWMKAAPSASARLDVDLGVVEKQAVDKGAAGKPAATSATPAASTKAEVVAAESAEDARNLAWFAAVDLGAFFALILLGFAYVWQRGDLDWVRALDTSSSRPARKLQLVR